MKTIWNWLNNSVVLFALLVLALITCLVSLGRWFELTKSDWGVWVGSIGTVCTLVGTIVIATSSERAKRDEQRDRALVAASGLLLQMKKVRDVLEFAVEHFSDVSIERTRMKYATQARLIEEADTWTEAQILPLIDAQWQSFVAAKKVEELERIITEENLNAEAARSFIDNAFRDGGIPTAGTAITKVLPPVSRFSKNNGHAVKKQTVLDKLVAFFERYFGLA